MKAITFRRKTLLALMIAMFGFGSMAVHAADGFGGQDQDEDRPEYPGQPTQYEPADTGEEDDHPAPPPAQ